jgi:hypothetical protein
MEVEEFNILDHKPDRNKLIIYVCPAKSTEKVKDFEEFKKHLVRCRVLQGKKGYLCKYNFAHVFLDMNMRSQHEEKCWAKDLGPKDGKELGQRNTIDLGKAGEHRLLKTDDIKELSIDFNNSSMIMEESPPQNEGNARNTLKI